MCPTEFKYENNSIIYIKTFLPSLHIIAINWLHDYSVKSNGWLSFVLFFVYTAWRIWICYAWWFNGRNINRSRRFVSTWTTISLWCWIPKWQCDYWWQIEPERQIDRSKGEFLFLFCDFITFSDKFLWCDAWWCVTDKKHSMFQVNRKKNCNKKNWFCEFLKQKTLVVTPISI